MESSGTKHFQPVFRNLKWNMSSTISIKVDAGHNLKETFHYHPQVELISLRNCKGSVIVGTKVCALEQDEVLLIGKNIPHGFFYSNEKSEREQAPHALVVQFDEYFMGKDFFSVPESYGIKQVLSAARGGLLVKENKKKVVAGLMERMLNERGIRQLLLLLEILNVMQEREEDYLLLREIDTAPSQTHDGNGRLQQVWSYTAEHYDQPIRIEEVAARINLTKESFCRFFKLKTNMTYMEYLFSYRIEKAKSMIMENKLSVKEIGYACGFLSLSNFYYQFKKIMHCSPLEYQNELFRKLNN